MNTRNMKKHMGKVPVRFFVLTGLLLVATALGMALIIDHGWLPERVATGSIRLVASFCAGVALLVFSAVENIGRFIGLQIANYMEVVWLVRDSVDDMVWIIFLSLFAALYGITLGATNDGSQFRDVGTTCPDGTFPNLQSSLARKFCWWFAILAILAIYTSLSHLLAVMVWGAGVGDNALWVLPSALAGFISGYLTVPVVHHVFTIGISLTHKDDEEVLTLEQHGKSVSFTLNDILTRRMWDVLRRNHEEWTKANSAKQRSGGNNSEDDFYAR